MSQRQNLLRTLFPGNCYTDKALETTEQAKNNISLSSFAIMALTSKEDDGNAGNSNSRPC
jgi:hypothetical protein